MRILNHDQERKLKVLQNTEAKHIIGIDEVGLGPCAGPLVVAGAVFEKGWAHEKVKDSKKFSGSNAHEKRVEVWLDVIAKQALYYAVEEVSHTDIDKIGLGHALEDAIRRVAIYCLNHYRDAVVAIDGERFPLLKGAVDVVAIEKGDDLVPAISAASIIAKVRRDEVMRRYDREYPQYGFARHVGYHTKEHLQALQEHGPCAIHRRSFEPISSMVKG